MQDQEDGTITSDAKDVLTGTAIDRDDEPTEISISPDLAQQSRNEPFRGCVDVFVGSTIMGWVIDIESPQRPIELRVELAGIALATTTTMHPRADISTLVDLPVDAGFQIDLESLSQERLQAAVTALKGIGSRDASFDTLFNVAIKGTRYKLESTGSLRSGLLDVASLIDQLTSYQTADVIDTVSTLPAKEEAPPPSEAPASSLATGNPASTRTEPVQTSEAPALAPAFASTPPTVGVPPARHRDAHLIDALFDADFYLSSFSPGQRPSDPASHYLTEGYLQGRDPARWFSGWHYLAMNTDVAAANMNPFLHYCLAGKRESRPMPRLGVDRAGDLYKAQEFAVNPGPFFEDFDPTIGIGRQKRAKVLAYYLPQFHAVEVNDSNWGTGFTEWRNLPRALPRFTGHVQPRIPRDLGCYDLSQGEAMRRQITMAKAAGLFGFCFYHYWFDGKRVLETPMERLLADPTLDFPFCLMWANENWTRTWDGFDREVILQQSYRQEDDAAFVADVARHMADPRYIRIGDRPVLFIYRPGNIPDARDTLARWRALFADVHGLHPFIMMAQGFGDEDPTVFGLDGAIEFPPHKICQGLPPINNSLSLLDSSYTGHVVSYDAMVQRSAAEPPQPFPLIRTVTPTWDNEARRPGRGMVIHGSTPPKFEAWLREMIAYAQENPVEGTPLVCVNAWNEWAEGAVLEPDVHHGAAYLNAVSRAVHGISARNSAQPHKVLIVGHDAHRNGAQVLALQIGRLLRSVSGVEVEYILCGPGPMTSEYSAVGKVHVLDTAKTGLDNLIRSMAAEGHTGAITNTTPSGLVVPMLKKQGLSVTSLIHELPNLLKSSKLEDAARAIARHSDHVVFPAEVVRRGFEAFAGRIEGEVQVQPQGLYKIDVLSSSPDDAGLRAELGLPEGCRIVLGVGYADLRKGIDRFIATAMAVCSRRDDVVFLWMGNPAGETQSWFLPEVAAAGLEGRILMPGYTENMARYFNASNIFYLSSREDPFPSVVLEALAAGLPVVGHMGTGGCDDLIARHGVLVSKTDPQAASTAVLDLLSQGDSSRRRAAAAARRQEVVQNYRFDDYVFGLLRRLDPDLVSVSAVVPNYNYEAYIGERLRSVFDQSYPLREVVVLDDASSDGSLNVIRATAEAAGRSITLQVNEKNSGSPFPQWRKGVELARGDYVWIAEADDLATPDFVARLIDRMRRAGSVLGFTDSAQIDETGAPLGPSYLPYMNEIEAGAFDAPFDMDGPDFLARFLAVKNVILNVSGVIFRRDALLDAFAAVGDGLYDYRVAGDWRLYAELCSRKGTRVSYLPDPLNTHRRHRVSVTHALNVAKHLAEIDSMHRLTQQKSRLSDAMKAKQAAHAETCKNDLMVGR